MKEWFTAAELAQLALPGLPKSKSKTIARANRESWRFRERQGRGGGREYHVEALPARAQDAIQRRGTADPAAKPAQLPTAVPQPTLAGLKRWQIEVMEARAALLTHVEAQRRDGSTQAAVIDRLLAELRAGTLPADLAELARSANHRAGNGRTLSRATLFGWLRLWRDGGVAALAPQSAAREGALPAWGEALMQVWGRPQRPSLPACLEAMGDAAPSVEQARRFLKRLSTITRNAGRLGPRALRNLKAYRVRDTRDLLPGDVYSADGHTFDAEVQHPEHGRPFRPEVTTVIDVATRRVVGWSAALSENTWGVLAAAQHAFVTSGVCAIWYVDNGRGFNNPRWDSRLTGFLGRFGVEKKNSLPYNSQARGIVERAHQSLWVRAAKELPTYLGDAMDNEARQRAFKITRAALKSGVVSALLLPWRAFLQRCADTVAAYNARPHGSLNGQSPDQAWAAAVERGWQPDLVGADERDTLFRPVEVRAATRGQVTLFGNTYFHSKLQDWHGEDVLVGYDIHDATRVWVSDLESRLICVAAFEANKSSYFPKAVIEQARERRATARLARLAVKQDEVLAELNPPLRLVGEASPAPQLDVQPVAEPIQLVSFTRHVSAQDQEQREGDHRYLRWRAVDRDIAAGLPMQAHVTAWHAAYRTTVEWEHRHSWAGEHGELPSGLGLDATTDWQPRGGDDDE